MFVLSRLSLVVRLSPSLWSRPLHEAIIEHINVNMANKVVHNVGLVVSVWDLVHIGESFILPGDGGSHTKVIFRVVVFRPSMEEVLVGKIKSCSPSGVHVTLGFFDDILIPPEALQHPCRFDDTEQVWIWEYPTDEGHHDLFMDPGEEIRFRMTTETFVDTSPSAPEPLAAQPGSRTDSEQEEKKIPYMLHGTVNEPGLGLLSWWT